MASAECVKKAKQSHGLVQMPKVRSRGQQGIPECLCQSCQSHLDHQSSPGSHLVSAAAVGKAVLHMQDPPCT